MHEPSEYTKQVQQSGEPVFREIGVGPWNEEHPGEPRPDIPGTPAFDARYDTELLDHGDRRNVLVDLMERPDDVPHTLFEPKTTDTL